MIWIKEEWCCEYESILCYKLRKSGVVSMKVLYMTLGRPVVFSPALSGPGATASPGRLFPLHVHKFSALHSPPEHVQFLSVGNRLFCVALVEPLGDDCW